MINDSVSVEKLTQATDELESTLRHLKFELLESVLGRIFRTLESEGFSIAEVFRVMPFAIRADVELENLLLEASNHVNEVDFSIADSAEVEL